MALPNSQYAEFIRARFQKGNRWDLGAHDAEAAALSMAPFQSATSSYSDDQVIHTFNYFLFQINRNHTND